MSDELKPCPHCGTEAQLMIDCGYYFGGCPNEKCYAESLGHVDRSIAIAAWNRRTPTLKTMPDTEVIYWLRLVALVREEQLLAHIYRLGYHEHEKPLATCRKALAWLADLVNEDTNGNA